MPILETSTCNISPVSKHANYLRSQDVIIFDEASMIPKYAMSAIEKMFADICNAGSPFGGKIILLGGDFRQCLPILERASTAEIIELCLKSSEIWDMVQVFKLDVNMRAGLEQQVFANWLLQLGDGKLPRKNNKPFFQCIELPESCVLQKNENHLAAIFNVIDGTENFCNRVVLTPTNDEALEINEQILDCLRGESVTYFSVDSVVSDDIEEVNLYPLEFLNSLTPSGMPPHKLRLKIGCVVMLLRNLDIKRGLCNGTRLKVFRLQQHVIDAEIITGVASGNRVLIPRVQLSPNVAKLPFQLKRRQFPLRLSYAMTINKSQGQTFEKVGIFLKNPCFSHGQLYVAFSRARSFNDVKIKVEQSEEQGYIRRKCYTKNIVYPQVLGH